MGSTPSPPPTPDPVATAQAQSKYNLDAAIATQAGSMVNQNTPYGSLTYTQTGTGPSGVPLWTANTDLNSTGQSMLDLLNKSKLTAGGQGLDLLKGANYGAQSPADVLGGMTSGTTKDLLDKETSYLDPFFTRDTTRLDTQLRNQGLSPGTPAYDQAMNALKQSQGQTVTGFLAQAEPQAYAQSLSDYLLPLQTGSQLMQLGSPTNPSFQTTPGLSVQPPNYQADVYNSAQIAQKNYENQLNANNNMMSGIFGVPSAVLGGWASSPSGGAALSSMFAAI